MREHPLVAFFVERFVFATSIFVGMVLVGLLLGLGLGVELLPRFSVPVIAISTSYPGAGPEEVAEQVSKPLEDALSTLTGVDVIGSSSTEGFSLVFVQFKQGVDVDQGAVEASQQVAAIHNDDAARHEGTRARGQQQQRPVELCERAGTAHRHARQQALSGLA